MEKPFLNLIILQMTSGESPAENLDQILNLLKPFEGNDVDWVCLPENSLYNKIKNSSIGLRLDQPEISALQKYADTQKRHIHLGAIPLREKQGVTNATVLLIPGAEPQVIYRKIHLFDMEMGSVKVKESDQFVAGDKPATYDYMGWRFGFSICYDLRFSELFLYYAQQEVDVLFAPSAFTKVTGKSHWRALVQGRAIENQCYMVAAAQSGVAKKEEISRVSFGHSMVVDSWGKTLVCMENSNPAAQLVTLEKAQIVKTRSILPIKKHRKLKIQIAE